MAGTGDTVVNRDNRAEATGKPQGDNCSYDLLQSLRRALVSRDGKQLVRGGATQPLAFWGHWTFAIGTMVSLKPLFPRGGDFVPQGTFRHSLETCLVVKMWGGGCYQHPVGGGQRCCW